MILICWAPAAQVGAQKGCGGAPESLGAPGQPGVAGWQCVPAPTCHTLTLRVCDCAAWCSEPAQLHAQAWGGGSPLWKGGVRGGPRGSCLAAPKPPFSACVSAALEIVTLMGSYNYAVEFSTRFLWLYPVTSHSCRLEEYVCRLQGRSLDDRITPKCLEIPHRIPGLYTEIREQPFVFSRKERCGRLRQAMLCPSPRTTAAPMTGRLTLTL